MNQYLLQITDQQFRRPPNAPHWPRCSWWVVHDRAGVERRAIGFVLGPGPSPEELAAMPEEAKRPTNHRGEVCLERGDLTRLQDLLDWEENHGGTHDAWKQPRDADASGDSPPGNGNPQGVDGRGD